MNSIIIKLPPSQPSGRAFGTLCVFGDDLTVPIYGPVDVDGKSDNQAAAANGNPSRDPTKAFGDTPYGDYSAHVGYEIDNDVNRRSYGMPDETGLIPVIWLTPCRAAEGDPLSQAQQRQANENAAAGHDVNMGLALHSGPPNAQGLMRPTHGCGRVKQEDQTAIVLLFPAPLHFNVSIEPQEAERAIK